MAYTPVGAAGEADEEREITAPLDVRSLHEAWARKSPRTPEQSVRLTFAAKTDLGLVRENNEDKFDFLEPEEPTLLAARGRFYAVADGMGGHAAGQIASEIGLKTVVKRYFTNTADDPDTALVAAIQFANGLVRDTAAAVPGRSGMGTTLTCAVIREGELTVAQVGDSRLYLLRDGVPRQVTEDHSWVAEQVRKGALDAETASRSPFRNVITRSLGAEPDVKVDLFHEALQPGDLLLLCSDGLTGQVPDGQIAAIAACNAPSVACMELIDAACASGGRDNITVAIIRVDGIEPYPGSRAAVPAPATAIEPEPEPAAEPAPAEPARRRGLFGWRQG